MERTPSACGGTIVTTTASGEVGLSRNAVTTAHAFEDIRQHDAAARFAKVVRVHAASSTVELLHEGTTSARTARRRDDQERGSSASRSAAVAANNKVTDRASTTPPPSRATTPEASASPTARVAVMRPKIVAVNCKVVLVTVDTTGSETTKAKGKKVGGCAWLQDRTLSKLKKRGVCQATCSKWPTNAGESGGPVLGFHMRVTATDKMQPKAPSNTVMTSLVGPRSRLVNSNEMDRSGRTLDYACCNNRHDCRGTAS
ncbi:hypothetical protein PHYSODRAFT_326655 [Phytophthora sojae]|uniref:Uncharacterized protein n=1 Tax=Phytophthora sojae (strain P6497) TaxID=1094619 RepID=G4YX93_PHYSP|nr:hypothetical protein PHYSODRAFT_326655 [Phytophthora sojae]EGZ25661.1 hypothetical protein PHYSODRAFT_326655 [Phytophthora sojae]|eukprot:XP_009520949.1 hypothetical protein PHYSODRAFT_326655 [Phytophthora sojae]